MEPSVSLYDGFKKGKEVAGSTPDFNTAETKFLKSLGKEKDLTVRDKPNVIGAYLTLAKYQEHNTKAQDCYRDLITSPKKTEYQTLFKKLSENAAVFKEKQAPGNFAIKTALLLGDTVDYLQTIPLPEVNVYDENVDPQSLQDYFNRQALQTEPEAASHKIISGAFGIGQTATQQEIETITTYLIERIERHQDKNLSDILQNYTLKSALASDQNHPNVKNHIAVCRVILSTAYALLHRDDEEILSSTLKGIQQNVGSEFISSSEAENFIKTTLQREAIRKVFSKKGLDVGSLFPTSCPKPTLLPTVKTGVDYEFKPEYQKIYKKYLNNTGDFENDIQADIEKYTKTEKPKNEPYTQRELLQNVVDFMIAIKKATLKGLEITGYKDGNITNKNSLNMFNLNERNQDVKVFSEYRYAFNKAPISEELKEIKPNLKSLVWLEELYSDRTLKEAKYNLRIVRERIRKFWDNLYEILVNAYVFAKENQLEKSFFHNAFPKELHCTDSLASTVQTWLKQEKESIGLDTEASYKKRLETQIKELIDANNIFMGAVSDNLIQYWLAPQALKWAKEKGQQLTAKDIDSNPKDILLLYEDNAKNEKMAGQFAQTISTLIRQSAKKRAVVDWNQYKHTHDYRIFSVDKELKLAERLSEDYHQYSTTDFDMLVVFKAPRGKESFNSSLSLKEVGDVRIYVKKRQSDPEDLATVFHNGPHYYVTLENYLKHEYLSYS